VPRSQVVQVGDKSITVTEKRVSELEDMFAKLIKTNIDTVREKDTTDEQFVDKLKSSVFTGIYGALELIAPGLAEDDIHNAYPNELETVVEAFISVNFTGLKKVSGPLLGLLQAGLKQKPAS